VGEWGIVCFIALRSLGFLVWVGFFLASQCFYSSLIASLFGRWGDFQSRPLRLYLRLVTSCLAVPWRSFPSGRELRLFVFPGQGVQPEIGWPRCLLCLGVGLWALLSSPDFYGRLMIRASLLTCSAGGLSFSLHSYVLLYSFFLHSFASIFTFCLHLYISLYSLFLHSSASIFIFCLHL
jgi:hypothetical protein